jgi:hypothetical protein
MMSSQQFYEDSAKWGQQQQAAATMTDQQDVRSWAVMTPRRYEARVIFTPESVIIAGMLGITAINLNLDAVGVAMAVRDGDEQREYVLQRSNHVKELYSRATKQTLVGAAYKEMRTYRDSNSVMIDIVAFCHDAESVESVDDRKGACREFYRTSFTEIDAATHFGQHRHLFVWRWPEVALWHFEVLQTWARLMHARETERPQAVMA